MFNLTQTKLQPKKANIQERLPKKQGDHWLGLIPKSGLIFLLLWLLLPGGRGQTQVVGATGGEALLTTASFIQQAYLKASNAEEDDEFGYAVAISGDTAVVDAYGEDSEGSGEADNSASSAAALPGASRPI